MSDFTLTLMPYILTGTKVCTLILVAMYGVFAFLVVRQIDLLNNIVGTPLSKSLQLFALFHLASVFIVFWLVILFL